MPRNLCPYSLLIHYLAISHSKMFSCFPLFRFFWCWFGAQELLQRLPWKFLNSHARTVAALEGLYAQCSVSVMEHGRCVHVKVCQFGECLVKWYTKTKKNPGHPPLSGRLFLQKGAKKKRSNIFAVREMLPKKMYWLRSAVTHIRTPETCTLENNLHCCQ